MLGIESNEIGGEMSQLASIREAIKQHNLNNRLILVGAIVDLLSFMLMTLSFVILSVGRVAVDPPTVIDPIIAAGYGFVFNRWFWVSMLLVSILGQLFGQWSHPETQLRRKLGAQAVANYKQVHVWPWR